MALTLRQLEIFRAIALRGSTTAAAQSVPLSQSATSAALKELENMLGVRLFDRVGKRLLLNDNGRVLLPAALGLLDGARTAAASFSREGTAGAGDLRLFASTTVGNYLLPRLLARFREIEPGMQMQLRIGNTQEVVEAVRQFEADLGLIEGPCHAAAIRVIPWLQDELAIVAAPTHELSKAAKRGRLTAAQLARALWLMREPGSGTREAVEQAFLSRFLRLPATMTLGSSEAIKNAVAEGLGVSYLSRYVVQDLIAAKRLQILNTQLPKLTRRLTIIHHEKKILSDSLRRFIVHCGAAKQLT
jgi:DNA-binding transcriptional LysR family regulator